MKLIKFNFLLTIATIIIVISGCIGSQKKTTQQEQDSTAVAMDIANIKNKDYYGTYEGTLPCADCGGIKTTLKINSDTTYDLRSEYLGKKNGIFEESGIYNIVGENIIELVTPSSGDKTYYKVLDGAVALSDSIGTINSGELSEQYILKRQ
ncbi:copper resistance protein NlpE [Bacteroides helcogenes]|uniref:Lipoprotein n=1 Tax=Bacteroides helcogenes (strain ATCC 35417 / DSM 20613 / JCM 6297 / CCUG 15421 / P 36-108) TaxID=693979 RepID=E6SU75_BACT6|nr:copper resistance protein NlpE [Bacteroides helcogenes]ADV44348.1 putative lipoprotein [Bacteroides helcogenes P 36-108]MDY5238244.1 copper resistance protein NlpE [Bacteroides helcogenes]